MKNAVMNIRKIFFSIILLINTVFFNNLKSENIPVIVVSPGKTIQSLGTVGSTIEIVTNDQIASSSSSSLASIIDNNTISTNLFQMGGNGANTGIQLRGLEKRYSTVYIDGVKMLDPSSADGSFYLENVMRNGIDRVEILKGTQTSLYGSNAIGGTINIFTKKGRQGKHSSFEIETASKNTKNITYSLDGADNKLSYYLGLNKFLTDGISSMNDNDEKDQYKNDNIIGNIGYKFNENFRLENSFRYANTFYEYDEVVKSRTDVNDSTDNIEGSYSLKLIHEKNKFKNTLSYNKLYIERKVTDYAESKQNYYGYRDAFNYLGQFNFNLDNKIIYGIDTEFDSSRYRRSWGARNVKHDEAVISSYFDYQFRPTEKLYSTFGIRHDDHTSVGGKQSGRATLAYLIDGNSKIRSSFGTGLRFPALYDYAYGTTLIENTDELNAERGMSFDVGYDTYINNLDLNLNITYFKTEQKNPLLSNARTGWKMMNGTGRNTSEGIEVGGKWKPVDKKFNLDFGYTFTKSYDANTCDSDELSSWSDNECRGNGSKVDKYKVRVPRHVVQSKINYSTSTNLQSSLSGKYISKVRDYGNQNDNWTDQILSDYFVFDLNNSYELFSGYKLNFGINNIFDEKYEQAWEYSTMGRTFNVGLKRVY